MITKVKLRGGPLDGRVWTIPKTQRGLSLLRIAVGRGEQRTEHTYEKRPGLELSRWYVASAHAPSEVLADPGQPARRDLEREAEIAAHHAQSKSLRKTGKAFGISGERVRQLLARRVA